MSENIASIRCALESAAHFLESLLAETNFISHLDRLEASLEGVRRAIAWIAKPGQAEAHWRTSPPPRGVRCMVTALDGGHPRVLVATLSPDHNGERWFSAGVRVENVIAWMPCPEPAEATGLGRNTDADTASPRKLRAAIEWSSILGANLAIAAGLDWSFRLGWFSCGCDQGPDPDDWRPGCGWTANSDASPRSKPKCICSDEEGDSKCERHPTCAGCGCSVERGVYMCEGCLEEARAPLVMRAFVGRCRRCCGWIWFAREDSGTVTSWVDETKSEGDTVAFEEGDIGIACADAGRSPEERTCSVDDVNACTACGNEIAPGRTRCGALECGGEPLSKLASEDRQP